MTPLTLGRAIAWAAIFDADKHRLPHWSAWSAELRAWADAQSTPEPTEEEDTP
ncbi:MAG: hypothetical protein ACOH10_07885 [Rhodoglobus sp.]